MIRIQTRIHLVQTEDIIMRDDIEPVMICLLLRISLSLCFKILQIRNTNIDNIDTNRHSNSNINSSNNSIKTNKEILYLV